MKNVQSARMQLLKGEAKAAARPGMNALPSAATKEIASASSSTLPALTEVQISEATTESARITSMALAGVPVKGEEKNLLDDVIKDAEIIKERSGKKGNWNKALNSELEPNKLYKVDDYSYFTDEVGRVNKVCGEQTLDSKDRNIYQQGKSVEIKDGVKGEDQGGHIIARIFNGPGEQVNYVPQTAALNNGEWKTMEKKWKDALSEGKKVEVDIQIIYDSDSKRPKRFLVEYKITNEPTVQRIFNN